MASFIETLDCFSGEKCNQDIDQFLKHIKRATELLEWTSEKKCNLLRLRLTGLAWDFVDNDPELLKLQDFDELCTRIRARFAPVEPTHVLLQRFRECQQNRDETAIAFASRVQMLAQKLDVSRGPPETDEERSFRQKLRDQDVRTHYLLGLKDSIRTLVRVQVRDDTPFKDIVSIAMSEEQNFIAR